MCHPRSEEHTSELQSRLHLVCRLLLEKKKHSGRSATASASGIPLGRIVIPSGAWPRTHVVELIQSSGTRSSGAARPPRNFFFNSPPPTKLYTLSLHDALPI